MLKKINPFLVVCLSLLLIVVSCKDDVKLEDDQLPANFEFIENLAVKYGSIIPLAIEVNQQDVKTIELIINDEVKEKWSNPTKNFTYQFDVTSLGIGAKTMQLKVALNNGDEVVDRRLIRVLSDIAPLSKTAKIVATYPHNSEDFTQGLEFSNGVLYESTGDPNGVGATIVAQKDLSTGTTIKKTGLDGNYFGEGITILDDKIYQLTWMQQKCFVYDKNNLEIQLKSFNYTGEGWGICNDGKNLIMSDGSERLVVRDPNSFQILRVIEVYDDHGPRTRLNELEYINGAIYANIWMLNIILVIDPLTGKVLEEIDASDVAAIGKKQGDVMNGIAYNHLTKKLYVTGKYWTNLFEIVVE